jgi:hypothetical protein
MLKECSGALVKELKRKRKEKVCTEKIKNKNFKLLI